MTSEELNAGILALDDAASDEKPIAYMGWFWRTVDFDRPTYSFGISPQRAGGPPHVAFMESNKWGYSTVTATPEAWGEIKRLLEVAVTQKTHVAIGAVRDAMAAVGAHLRAGSITQDKYGFDETKWEDTREASTVAAQHK